MTLTASFVRHRDRRDRIYVARENGTSIFWDFPTYGDRLPHDLCHLVVEEGLGVESGFWGLVDQGVDVKLIDNQATLVRHGRPLVEEPGIDFSDLMKAEEAVALLSPTGMETEQVGSLVIAHLDALPGPDRAPGHPLAPLGFDLAAGTSPTAIASTRHRLHELDRQWRDLLDGEAVVLTFRAGPLRG